MIDSLTREPRVALSVLVSMGSVGLPGQAIFIATNLPVTQAMGLPIAPLPVLMAPNPEWKPLLKATHYWLNMTLLAAFALHVLAALKHQFIDRDGLISRMLPGRA